MVQTIKGLGSVGVGFVVGVLLAVLVLPVAASIPDVYTNDNIWTSTHDAPVTISLDSDGNFFGTTATGKLFSQVRIENSLNVRLQKFAIDEAFYYISDRGIINAQSDVVALSIYLTLG
jgi:hypothetical protein